jgi:hypothetical protein
MRHHYARWMIASGVPIEIVSKMLGHSTIGITSDYDLRFSAAITPARLRAAGDEPADEPPDEGAADRRPHDQRLDHHRRSVTIDGEIPPLNYGLKRSRLLVENAALHALPSAEPIENRPGVGESE